MIARSAAHQIKYYGLAVSGWVFTRAGPTPDLRLSVKIEPTPATPRLSRMALYVASARLRLTVCDPSCRILLERRETTKREHSPFVPNRYYRFLDYRAFNAPTTTFILGAPKEI